MTSVATPARPGSEATAAPFPASAKRLHRWRRGGGTEGGRRPLWPVAVLAALVLGLAVASWLVFFSSVLAAKRVEITGLSTLTVEQVQGAAAVPLGDPLVRIDLRAISARTAQVPKVERAEASRKWPNTVVLDVVERQPVLAVAQPGGYQIVDRLGVAYDNRVAIPTGVLVAQIDPGNQILLSQASTVVNSLSPNLRKQVDTISAYSSDDLTLTLRSGVIVVWGDAGQSDLKSQVVDAVVKRKPQVSVDVSSPHTPAYR